MNIVKAILWFLALCMAIIVAFFPVDAEPSTSSYNVVSGELVDQPQLPTITEMIGLLAPRYGQDPNIISKLAKCESGHNPSAINYDDGAVGSHSYGLFQFKIDTWNRYEKLHFEERGEHLNMDSAYDSIKLASYIFSRGEYTHWYNCSRKIGMI